MIPVSLTCEVESVTSAEPEATQRYRPVIRVNGDTVWRGRPVDDPGEAESVALGFLRYSLGGLLIGPHEDDAAPSGTPGGDAPNAAPLATSLDQVVEGLRREITDGMQRLQDFIDGGEWKRFLP